MHLYRLIKSKELWENHKYVICKTYKTTEPDELHPLDLYKRRHYILTPHTCGLFGVWLSYQEWIKSEKRLDKFYTSDTFSHCWVKSKTHGIMHLSSYHKGRDFNHILQAPVNMSESSDEENFELPSIHDTDFESDSEAENQLALMIN